MLLYDIHHLSCGGRFSQQGHPVFPPLLFCLTWQLHPPLTLLPSQEWQTVAHPPRPKSLVFSSVKLCASQARMLIMPLQPIFTGHIRLLVGFIMLQLPYSLSYEAMFVKAPMAY